MRIQNEENPEELALVRLCDEDKSKMKECYRDIAWKQDDTEEDFNLRFAEFLGDGLKCGSNQRIMGRFFNMKNPEDRAKLEYFFKVYTHSAAGERAEDADWTVRAGILVALVAPAAAFLADFLVAFLLEEDTWYSQPSLFFLVAWAVAAAAFWLKSTVIIKWLKRRKANREGIDRT